MLLNEIFKKASSDWVRYSKYDIKEKEDIKYIVPAKDAHIITYNPLENAETMILDAINTGRILYDEKASDKLKQDLLMSFVHAYGLLGFMTDLPLNSNFIECADTFLGENLYTDNKVMTTKEYIQFFTPFEAKDISHTPIPTLSPKEQSLAIAFSHDYAERYSWVFSFLMKFYLYFATCKMYEYTDNPATKSGYTNILSLFQIQGLGIKLEMNDTATLVWDFRSLKMILETFYAVSISNKDTTLKMCKHCGKSFYAQHGRSTFCSSKCRNQYNVYKFREREKKKQEQEN